MARLRFSFRELLPVVREIARADPRAVLVGGQVVGGWGEYFEPRHGPGLVDVASKDVDLIGDRETVRACAERLGGRPQFPSLDNVVAAQLGIIKTNAPDGSPLRIDVLGNLFGLDAKEIRTTAISIELESEDSLRLRLLHPVLCLESRVHNVAGLPGQYDTPHGHAQLAVAIRCARAYQEELLDGTLVVPDPVRTVLKLNERIAKFATRDPHARALLRDHGVDVASAMYFDERLPRSFLEVRLPQLQALLRARALWKDGR